MPEKPKSRTTGDPWRLDLKQICEATETIALSSGMGTSGAVPAGYQPGLDLGKIVDQTIAGVLGGLVDPEQMRVDQWLDRLSKGFPQTTTDGVTTFTYPPIGAQPWIDHSGAPAAWG